MADIRNSYWGWGGFGQEITKFFASKKKKEVERDIVSFVPKSTDDDADAILVSAGGYYGHYFDVAGLGGTLGERDLIYRYRAVSEQSEVDGAISDIVDEAIASPDEGSPVKLKMNSKIFSDDIRKKVYDEFDKILELLEFSKYGYDIFRRWYIDGRSYFHVIVDRDKPQDGIQELRALDAAKIRRVKEIREEIDKRTGVKVAETVEDFYVFTDPEAIAGGGVTTGVKIAKDAIAEVNSGLMDAKRKIRLSYLHKALKVVNQLRIMEDSLVIYRLARAPERRIFYVDTGNLPRGKAEEYMRQVMSKYRNKVVYDVETGSIKDERKHMSMLEDFWIPRREGNSSTEVETLPGGANLGDIEDIEYFKKQLYKSLNVPVGRADPESGFPGGTGRATEITRDEVKFQKFINRLRKKFSYLLIDLLHQQLRLKSIITEADWKKLEQGIVIDFIQDNYFYEAKQSEMLQDRLALLSTIDQYVGKHFSKEWVRKNVLLQTDDEIDIMQKQIETETSTAGIDIESEFN